MRPFLFFAQDFESEARRRVPAGRGLEAECLMADPEDILLLVCWKIVWKNCLKKEVQKSSSPSYSPFSLQWFIRVRDQAGQGRQGRPGPRFGARGAETDGAGAGADLAERQGALRSILDNVGICENGYSRYVDCSFFCFFWVFVGLESPVYFLFPLLNADWPIRQFSLIHLGRMNVRCLLAGNRFLPQASMGVTS